AARGVDVPSAQRHLWAGILSPVMTIALGLVLFACSSPLARLCAEPSRREAGNGSNGCEGADGRPRPARLPSGGPAPGLREAMDVVWRRRPRLKEGPGDVNPISAGRRQVDTGSRPKSPAPPGEGALAARGLERPCAHS